MKLSLKGLSVRPTNFKVWNISCLQSTAIQYMLRHLYCVVHFIGLCDFQYLPMVPNSESQSDNSDKFLSILEQAVPQKLEPLDWINDTSAPIFLSPPVFSRMDTPMVNMALFTVYSGSTPTCDHCFYVSRITPSKRTFLVHLMDLSSLATVTSSDG